MMCALCQRVTFRRAHESRDKGRGLTREPRFGQRGRDEVRVLQDGEQRLCVGTLVGDDDGVKRGGEGDIPACEKQSGKMRRAVSVSVGWTTGGGQVRGDSPGMSWSLPPLAIGTMAAPPAAPESIEPEEQYDSLREAARSREGWTVSPPALDGVDDPGATDH